MAFEHRSEALFFVRNYHLWRVAKNSERQLLHKWIYSLQKILLCLQKAVQWLHRCIFFHEKKPSTLQRKSARKTMAKTKSKRVRLTSDAINSYGSRILTAGLDTSQYERNPVLLYMHRRGEVIGYLDKIERDEEGITAELVFDEASETSQRCKKQWEFGSLRMVSVGIDIMEWSDAKEHLLQGQTHPTITKSKLTEVSLVDIGANDDAIVLYHQGKQLQLSEGGDFPLLPNSKLTPKINNTMNQAELAKALGLPENADESAILAKLNEQKAQAQEAETLRATLAAQTEAAVEAEVAAAVADHRVQLSMKDHYLQLGRDLGVERLRITLASLSPREKITETLGHQASPKPLEDSSQWKKLSDVPEAQFLKLRSEDPETYKRLYKAEYGIECPPIE